MRSEAFSVIWDKEVNDRPDLAEISPKYFLVEFDDAHTDRLGWVRFSLIGESLFWTRFGGNPNDNAN